jgi:hypothetical protein
MEVIRKRQEKYQAEHPREKMMPQLDLEPGDTPSPAAENRALQDRLNAENDLQRCQTEVKLALGEYEGGKKDNDGK